MKTLDHIITQPTSILKRATSMWGAMTAIAIGFLCCTFSTSAATNELSTFLQKGLLEEEANQDLNAATRAYEMAVRHFDQDRKLAATALFRLSEVYRKQGRTNEATVYYQRIVREFSDQKTLADLSRERLSVLSPSSKALAESKTPPGMETVVTGIILNSYDAELQGQWLRSSFPSQFGDYVFAMARSNTSDVYTATFIPDLPESGNYHVDIWYVEAENRVTNAPWVIRNAEKTFTNYVNQRVNGNEWLRIASNVPFKKGRSGSVQLSNRVKEIFGGAVVVADAVRFVRAGTEVSGKAPNSARTAPAPDEQDEDIQRLQAIMKNSPDLLDALETSIEGGEMGGYLHDAASKGHEKVVQYLLENGADINLTSRDKRISNPKGYTPLHVAAGKGHQHIVKILISKGADIKAQTRDGDSALHIAARIGFKMIAADLLTAGADVNSKTVQGETPLHLAAHAGHKSLVEFLIQKGANVNAVSKSGGTPLFAAVGGNSYESARLLITKGANVNAVAEGETALGYAVKDGKERLAELLIENGADINSTMRGMPLLRLAIDRGSASLVSRLLNHGASPNAVRNNEAPLFQAIDRKNTAVIEALISGKADLAVTNGIGATPLHIAAQVGSIEIVQLLLKAGAPLEYTDSNGSSPLMYAVQSGKSLPVIEALLKSGANPNRIDQFGRSTIGIVQSMLYVPRGLSRTISRSEPNWKEVLSLLKNHGGDEVVQRQQEIRATRAGFQFPEMIFSRARHEANRFTLFEAISESPRRGFDFPDFERITIHRLDGKDEKQIVLNLKEALAQGDCSKDQVLEWGDIIEIPREDVLINLQWPGLSPEILKTLSACLTKSVRLQVSNEEVTIEANPSSGGSLPGPARNSETSSIGKIYSSSPWLSHAVSVSPLRSSSDLSRVQVTRIDPSTKRKQTYTFDLRKGDEPFRNLWLREGDVIQVPEKSSDTRNSPTRGSSTNDPGNSRVTADTDSGSVELFNGKDLTGWSGEEGAWSVKDGAIRGEMKSGRNRATALIWKGGEVKDFELRALYRFIPEGSWKQAVAGITYRARQLSPFEVRGYQYRVTRDGNNTGMLTSRDRNGMISYTQKTVVDEIGSSDRIRKVADLERLPVILQAIKKDDWNEVLIVAKGNHFVHKINGKVIAEMNDANASRVAYSGLLALELLTDYQPYVVEFKDLRLKRLSQ